MQIEKETVEKINNFVKEKPRTIQEVALLINRSWRTADRYVKEIEEKEGTMGVRTFRKGTRGALKIVYWKSLDNIGGSAFQELLFKRIELGKNKLDFSPFDIYQCVDSKKRNAFLEQQEDENVNANQNIMGILREAQKEVLFFSGNLSWANLYQNGKKITDVFKELAERDVTLKFLTRVDVTSIKNVEKILALNKIIGKERIFVRHYEQPLRAFVVDNKLAQFKEIKNPKDYEKEELNKRTYIFYEIYDKEWVEWIINIFYSLYRSAIPAQDRLKNLKTIQNILKV